MSEPSAPTIRSTENDTRSAAEVCRSHGWDVGTRLIGDEGYGPTVIRITAVGVREILAVTESHKGRLSAGNESSWVLWCRDWHLAPPPPVWCSTAAYHPSGRELAWCELTEGHDGQHVSVRGCWNDGSFPPPPTLTPENER